MNGTNRIIVSLFVLVFFVSVSACTAPSPEEREAQERNYQLPHVTADLGKKEVVEVLDIPTMNSKAVVYCRNPHPGKVKCDGDEDTAILEAAPEPGAEVAEVYVKVVTLGNRSTSPFMKVAYLATLQPPGDTTPH